MVHAGLESELVQAEDGSGDWWVREDGEVTARCAYQDVRISVSWKAEVFADDTARRVREEHMDDLTLDAVVDRFLEDLADRGTPMARPAEPLSDPEFIAALAEVHRLPELVYPTEDETRAKRRS